MKITASAAGARNPFYDRGPVGIAGIFTQVQAPVGNTVEWTYTVPSGRKAILDAATCASTRATAAGTAADVFMSIAITVFVSAALVPISWMHWLDNAIAVLRQAVHQGQPVLLAGDILNSRYADLSTGGTVNVAITAHLTEFDA